MTHRNVMQYKYPTHVNIKILKANIVRGNAYPIKAPFTSMKNGFHRKIFSEKSFSLKIFSIENILRCLPRVWKITKYIYSLNHIKL